MSSANIHVCPLSRVTEQIALHAPERIVSLLDPGFEFPDAGPDYRGRHLCLRLHDVHEPTAGQIVPSTQHVAELLAFLAAWERSAPLLIHCRAGIGRSTATAYIAACMRHPKADEREIMDELRRASPWARPNETLISLADNALQRSGRMSRAVAETGRGLPRLTVNENVPFELPGRFGEMA